MHKIYLNRIFLTGLLGLYIYIFSFLQFSWSKSPDQYLCMGKPLCGVYFYNWLATILISHWKFTGWCWNKSLL